VNYSQSAGNATSHWTTVVKVSASPSPDLYNLTISVSSQYDRLEYRILSSWLDFGKEQPGRASPPSAVVKPATVCSRKFVIMPVCMAFCEAF